MHVLDAWKTDLDFEIYRYIYSPDTYTFVFLIDLVASNRIEENLNYETGRE